MQMTLGSDNVANKKVKFDNFSNNKMDFDQPSEKSSKEKICIFPKLNRAYIG